MLVCLLSFTFLYVFITCIAAFVRNKLMMMMMNIYHRCVFLAPDVAAATFFSFLLICVFNPDSELILVSISH